MAKLSSHGAELFRRETLSAKIAYMADGHILRNSGGSGGWRRYRKLKPGIDPAEHAAKAQALEESTAERRPAYFHLRECLQELVSFEDRWKVVETIKLLDDDVDGIWSELNDCGGVDLSVEDVQKIVDAWRAALAEQENQSLGEAVVKQAIAQSV